MALIASASSPNGLYYATGVNTYYWKPIIDPRSSSSTLHKVIIGCMSSNANASQGLYEFTGTVANSSVTGSWAMVFGQSGSNSFNFDMGWNDISPQVRQYNYTPTSWPDRKVLLASQQSLYYGDPALPNNTANKYEVLSTEYIGTSGSYKTYKTRGFQSTVNFDGTGYKNYVAQGMADNRILESWDNGNSWTQNSRPGGGQNCDYVDIIPPNGTNRALVITAAGGGFGGVNDNADASHWGKYLSDPALPTDAWVSLETGTSGLSATTNTRTYGSAYNPFDFKNVVLATQDGLLETKDIYARMSNTGGVFSFIGPAQGTSFKNGDVFFDPDNGNILYANSSNTIYKLTRTAIDQPWTTSTITAGTTQMNAGNFYFWKNNSDSYFAYSNTSTGGDGPRIFLKKNDDAWIEILNRAQVIAVNTEPWLSTWTDGSTMHITFSGLAGHKNQIIVGSQVEDGKHGYNMLRGIIANDGSVTWSNWSGTFGTSEFMEVARLWDAKMVTQPKANLDNVTYYYAATRGAGLWRREVPGTLVLPITWGAFNLQKRVHGVQLNWTTLTESKSTTYEIERAGADGAFRKIGSVPAAGNTSSIRKYSFLDDAPLSGLNIYRIKHIDSDGVIDYSPLQSINFSLENKGISLFPIPTAQNLNISFDETKTISLIKVYDVKGQVVLKESFNNQSYLNLKINVAALQPGVYFVEVTEPSVKSSKIKFLKL